MTPVALWTGRLPGLRRLPREWTLWGVGGIVGLGAAGSFGLLGEHGPWLGIVGSLTSGWIVWRHRWPTELPMRLNPLESPRGADERAVIVEFRHDGALLGWDVGILWFEKGGIGFVGRTVSFVLPRAIMQGSPGPPAWQATLRAPQMTAKVFETTVGIVPLDRDLQAQMTLARIDALPEAITSETILPPSSLHPDLVARGLAVQRRKPILYAFALTAGGCLYLPSAFDVPQSSPAYGMARAIAMLAFVGFSLLGAAPVPASVRARLPKEARRRA